MKTLMIITLLVVNAIAAQAQFAGVATAISNKDITALSNFFGEQVEITTPEKDGIFKKAAATEVMKGFFEAYKPSSFKLVHQGASKGKSSEYAIGEMKTASKSFRVFIYISEDGGKTIVQQLQFEQE